MKRNYTNILRAPHQVSFDITNKCNLRCLHCYNSSGENDVVANELTDLECEEFFASVSQMNLYNFCFCGGETLLRKDLIIKGLKVLKASGSHCCVVTNGLLADISTLKDLETNGLDAIQFSLDGYRASHDKLRNRPGAYEAVISAIENTLYNTNLHVAISFTPTAFNIDDFETVYNLLFQMFSKSPQSKKGMYIDLRMQPLMILGRAKHNMLIVPTDYQYRKLVQMIHKVETELNSDYVRVKWGDPVDHLIRYRQSGSVMDQISVHANGDIVASAYLPLVVGNIRKHSLQEYWDQGLNHIWQTNIVQFLAAQIQSIQDMEKLTNKIADINMDGGLSLDLMENDLDDLSLIQKLIF